MKTQCPSCGQLWNIESDEQDQSMECFSCKTKFNAAPYSGPVPKEPPPIPFKPSQTTQPYQTTQPCEEISCPGGIWYFLGGTVGIFGILGGLLGEEIGVIIAAAMFWLVATAVGGVLNRLERIAHHTEKICEEIKQEGK